MPEIQLLKLMKYFIGKQKNKHENHKNSYQYISINFTSNNSNCSNNARHSNILNYSIKK